MLLLWGWGSPSLLPAAFSAGSPWRCTPSCKSDASLSSCPWGLSQLCLGAGHCVGGSPVSLATMWACPGSHSLGSVGSYSELSCAHPPTPFRRLRAAAAPHSRPPSRNPLADPCAPEHGGEGLACLCRAGPRSDHGPLPRGQDHCQVRKGGWVAHAMPGALLVVVLGEALLPPEPAGAPSLLAVVRTAKQRLGAQRRHGRGA